VDLTDAEREKLDVLLGGDAAAGDDVAAANGASATPSGAAEALVDPSSSRVADIPELRLFVLLRAGLGGGGPDGDGRR
jgi:hypothetical protein